MDTYAEVPQPPAGDSRWKALGIALRSRREQLSLSQNELASRGGPSAATVRYAENGQGGPYRALTITAFERALQWEPGSFLKALNGGEADPTPQPEKVGSPDIVTALARIEAQLARLQDLPDLIASQARSVKVPDTMWPVLAAIANDEDTTMADALTHCIESYAKEHQTQ